MVFLGAGLRVLRGGWKGYKAYKNGTSIKEALFGNNDRDAIEFQGFWIYGIYAAISITIIVLTCKDMHMHVKQPFN